MNEKQRLYHGEINIVDFILYCLEKWRWIVVSMLIISIMMGAYKYRTTERENIAKQKQIQESAIENDEKENSNKEDDNAEDQTIKFYEQAIRELEKELKIKDDYLNTSVVMQMDPYHVSMGTLSYYVEEEDREYNRGVLAAYNAFISGGRLAEELYELDDSVPIEDLQYLISFSDSESKQYKFDETNNIFFSTESGMSVFEVRIKMPDSDLAARYLKYAEDILTKFTAQLRTEIGEHKMVLLSSVQSEIMDSEMQERQSTIRAAYATSVKNLQTLHTELETIQNAQTPEGGKTAFVVDANFASPVTSDVKFAVLGLILGAFLACFILLISYLMGGKLQDLGDFNIEYGMPLLGIVRVSELKNRLFGFIDSWIFRMRDGVYAKICFEEQVKMTIVNIQMEISKKSVERTMQKIMISGTIEERDAEILCNRLKTEIPEVSFSSYSRIVFQASALKGLEKYDGIVFLETKGVSNSNLISQERALASDRDVKVLGTIVLC